MRTFEIYADNVHLGTITEQGNFDMFWAEETFTPAPAFASFQPLFDRERRLLEADRMEEWQEAWDEIEQHGLRLVPADGSEPISEFLVHIDGRTAWWRY